MERVTILGYTYIVSSKKETRKKEKYLTYLETVIILIKRKILERKENARN